MSLFRATAATVVLVPKSMPSGLRSVANAPSITPFIPRWRPGLVFVRQLDNLDAKPKWRLFPAQD